MRTCWLTVALLAAGPMLLQISAAAATKPHVIAFGKALPAKLYVGPDEETALEIKVRPLLVDGKIKEFTLGEPHDVTDRLFVVRRAFRLNDALPADPRNQPRWRWQRGGWLLVDRETGHVGNATLPEFDPFYSVVSWYRDYAAYCGISDAGDKVYAVVAEIGRKKAVLRKELGAAKSKDMPDSECASPEWQRSPIRVTFSPAGSQPLTIAVHGHAADVAATDDSQ